MSDLEDEMASQLRYLALAGEIPVPVRELRFAPPRRWRFDFAWPDRLVALEIDGGTWVTGRHSRGAGMERDAEKYNAAAARGWRVLRVTTDMVRDGRARQAVEAIFAGGAGRASGEREKAVG